ncbi:unnamed protein product [Polarella glacialis]|uniref:Uncharacterized protein n=1 Tax=Polarella glacialis TaxID=89957 RepID=A0A813G8D2_POLGL|nr:unnamed protein product [Polarella glacialis]
MPTDLQLAGHGSLSAALCAVALLQLVLFHFFCFFVEPEKHWRSGLCMVVWGPLCAVTWLLFFSWCTGVDPTFFLHASMALSFLPFICFQVAWLPVGALLNLLLVPCGAGEESLYFLMQIPFATVMSLLEAFGANQLRAEPGQGLASEDEASDSEV